METVDEAAKATSEAAILMTDVLARKSNQLHTIIQTKKAQLISKNIFMPIF